MPGWSWVTLRGVSDDIALEHQGVLTRTACAEVPPRVGYALTERGQSFRAVLEAMAAWGDADLTLHAAAA